MISNHDNESCGLPTAKETAAALVGMSAWVTVYCAARLVGGVLALCVWGAKSAVMAVRGRWS